MAAMMVLNYLRLALKLARRGFGSTSPNPMVGAVLVKAGRIIGRGWHRRAGEAHAEIEALRDAELRGHSPRGATLFVTLEPCSTLGRTPPCTEATVAAGIEHVVMGTLDPNPSHRGRAVRILKRAGIAVDLLATTRAADRKRDAAARRLLQELNSLNEPFNHWIVHRTPLVTVKAAMTLDGKLATPAGESKWITGEEARAYAMKLRRGSDAIVVGVNTVLADDPSLTIRSSRAGSQLQQHGLRRIILDSMARTPLTANVVNDSFAGLTTVVVSRRAPAPRVAALAKRVKVIVAPLAKTRTRTVNPGIDLPWLLRRLGKEEVTCLLVEGGGEVNASFLLGGLAHRVAFFLAPKILGGHRSPKAVGGARAESERFKLASGRWRSALAGASPFAARRHRRHGLVHDRAGRQPRADIRIPVNIRIIGRSPKVILRIVVDTLQATRQTRSRHRGAAPLVDFRMAIGEREACRTVVVSGRCIRNVRRRVRRKCTCIIDAVRMLIHVNPGLSGAGDGQLA
jgi:diaminohydroxyphosphoribosylaminopyrimidine deaminase/5-amino-6-(5-phosphoribosylamino)uracil reductase